MLMPTLFHNDLFDDFFDFPRRTIDAFESSNTVMKTDILEEDNNYTLIIDLPGFKKEEVKANIKDGYLTVSATRNVSKEDSKKYLRRERFVGTMSRSYYVGEDLTQKDICASFSDGTLKISFPKEETKKVDEPKFIEIN